MKAEMDALLYFADDVTISGYNSVFSVINTSLISDVCHKSPLGLHSHLSYENMEVRGRHGPADPCRLDLRSGLHSCLEIGLRRILNSGSTCSVWPSTTIVCPVSREIISRSSGQQYGMLFKILKSS